VPGVLGVGRGVDHSTLLLLQTSSTNLQEKRLLEKLGTKTTTTMKDLYFQKNDKTLKEVPRQHCQATALRTFKKVISSKMGLKQNGTPTWNSSKNEKMTTIQESKKRAGSRKTKSSHMDEMSRTCLCGTSKT
jgi:hypothetical protein